MEIIFSCEYPPTLRLTPEGRLLDLSDIEVILIRDCFNESSLEWEYLCHAKVVLEIACCEYLKHIKTHRSSRKILVVKPTRNAYPHSFFHEE